jgi:hypothetical protein
MRSTNYIDVIAIGTVVVAVVLSGYFLSVVLSTYLSVFLAT